MPESKPFISYAQQIDKLVNEKLLVINDRAYAESVLKQISYYALVSGYKGLFLNPTTKKYKDNTAFEEIVALYRFDESLRELFLRYLLRIEQTMRSLLSYSFTEKHGHLQSEYLCKANYDQNPRKSNDLSRLLNTLRGIVLTSTNYASISYHRNIYGNVPLWALVKVLTFGNISKMYQCFTQDLKIKVSKNFNKVNEKELMQYMKVLTIFRNVCAHSDRLFSHRSKDDIPDTAIHAKLGIPKKGTQYVYGKRDLFGTVIAFRYLLPREDFRDFKAILGRTIDNFIANTNHVTHNELLHEMGFPGDWKKISLYKL